MGKKKLRSGDSTDRDWTPVSRGKTYCSPACGRGCTRGAYLQAVRDADRLVARLVGPAWKAVVWENLGWHFGAVSGPVQVYGARRARDESLCYTCLISDRVENPSGGSMIWAGRAAHCHDDPNVAVECEFESALLATTGVVRALYAAYVAQGGPTVGLLPLAASMFSKVAASLAGGKR